jgi:hypothetical protein
MAKCFHDAAAMFVLPLLNFDLDQVIELELKILACAAFGASWWLLTQNTA